MKITTSLLLAYIEKNHGSRPSQMADNFDVSTMTIHRHLDKLLSNGSIQKRGRTPHVRYYPMHAAEETVHLPPSIQRMLEAERYQISKTGTELIGVIGFVIRCKKRDLDPLLAAHRWATHIEYIDSITTPYGIDAKKKLYDYGGDILTYFWYGSIYALPEFGKTKAGTLMELAKTFPHTDLFDALVQGILPMFNAILTDFGIDSLCFAQPTAKRTKQIMKYIEQVLGKSLPVLPLYKVPGFFPAQKTLKKLEDRITNAQVSFDLESGSYETYKHTLIIDDAVGSGATLVEIGRKLLHEKRTNKVSAFSVTGTANGIFSEMKHFEVLSSV